MRTCPSVWEVVIALVRFYFSTIFRPFLGQRFALLEEKTVLATLLRRYTFTSVHKRHEIRPTADLVLRPHRGTWVIIESRKNM